jgi:hypothetical protein
MRRRGFLDFGGCGCCCLPAFALLPFIILSLLVQGVISALGKQWKKPGSKGHLRDEQHHEEN